METKSKFVLLIVFILALETLSVQAFFWQWLQSSKVQPSPHNDHGTAISKVVVTFGLSSTDEKFLQQAKEFEESQTLSSTNDNKGLSGELADCHSRLILSLKQDCSKLKEEQIGKMAVNLLNCQNAIEKRQQFRCTPKMTLAECTKGMDSSMYTVYHLMTNRALAICHSVTQRLFKLKTEMLINHLATASQGQLGSLKEMHDWHLKLQDLQSTAQTQIKILNEQHDGMVATQQSLLDRQKLLETSLTSNAQQLEAEQKTLKDGSNDLLQLTNQVKQHLDSTVTEVQKQDALLQEQRTKMDSTLADYETSLRNLMKELHEKGSLLTNAQDETFSKVQASLEGIDKVNRSLGALGQMMMTTQEFFTERMQKIHTLLETDVSADTALTYFVHSVILALLMVLSSFLRFPMLSRLLILFTVPFNVYLRTSMKYFVTLEEIGGAVLVAFLTELLVMRFWRKRSTAPASKKDVEKLFETIRTMEQRINEMTSPPRTEEFVPLCPPPYFEKQRLFAEDVVEAAVNRDWDRMSIAGSDISSHISGEKLRCQGTTRDGLQCKRLSSVGLCPTHRRSSKVSSIR